MPDTSLVVNDAKLSQAKGTSSINIHPAHAKVAPVVTQAKRIGQAAYSFKSSFSDDVANPEGNEEAGPTLPGPSTPDAERTVIQIQQAPAASAVRVLAKSSHA